MVLPVIGCTTGAQKCSISASYLAFRLPSVIGLDDMKALGIHVVLFSSYTRLVRRLTASCDMMLGKANGIREQFGVRGCITGAS